jgi:hypothetical protein
MARFTGHKSRYNFTLGNDLEHFDTCKCLVCKREGKGIYAKKEEEDAKKTD